LSLVKQPVSTITADSLEAIANTPEVDRMGVRLKICMGGIHLNLVNKNNRLKHAWVEVRSLELLLTQSP
jgi:hypothetical protein